MYSEWRRASVDARLVAMVANGPKNELYMIKCNGVAYGLCAISSVSAVDASGMIWFLRAPDVKRKPGAMTAAVKLLAKAGFEDHGLHTLTAQVFAGNAGSERVILGAGFRKVGTLRESAQLDEEFRDKTIFDMLADDLWGRAET